MSSASSFRPRVFEQAHLDKIAYPIGGLGTGMFCLSGTGAFSHFSIRHKPNYFNDLLMFSALAVRDKEHMTARVLEGPVPAWKPVFPWDRDAKSSGHGGGGMGFGLARFDEARFSARFPFADVDLNDKEVPLDVSITGWSPFIPSDPDSSGLPVGAVEYRFRNESPHILDLVYSFHAKNFLSGKSRAPTHSVRGTAGGFILQEKGTLEEPAGEGACAAWIDDPAAKSDLAWFRGGWFDTQTIIWKNISEGHVVEQNIVTEGDPSPGGSLYLPLSLAPGEVRTIRLLLAWYVPYSTLREGHPNSGEGVKLDPRDGFYRPWYASRFSGIDEVTVHWTKENERLRAATVDFSEAFYDTTLPSEIIDAVAANLTILKTPTVLREKGGKMWAWEGTGDEAGSCYGTCTHVWNYAQAVPHLFPSLERGLRETEFLHSQDERGHQNFRSALPLGPTLHDFHAAADGQLGGIIKVYRDWRISGDTAWLKRLWPRIRESLNFCIESWDPERRGGLIEPHHNTYDIEFWGADGMGTSIYLAALQAAGVMAQALGGEAAFYEKLAMAGKEFLEGELFNGEYFIQKIQWKGLHAPDPIEAAKVGFNINYSAEAKAILEMEGPKYQYGIGCLSDGIVGEWMAWSAGLEMGLHPQLIESHLTAVYRHNFRANLAKHSNPQRPGYAFNNEAGLLLCTWPRGGALTLPFIYSDEVWTGVEYQVAAHLISLGQCAKGLEIVRACRNRYEGKIRNPFGEIECGHWYARALASYSLLQACSGARYDAVERKLYLAPSIAGDFRSFLAFDGGYGTVGVQGGKPFWQVRSGVIEVQEIVFISCQPCEGGAF